MLDEDKDTTGIPRLSQGLNKDAVSKQILVAMVNSYMSMQRQKNCRNSQPVCQPYSKKSILCCGELRRRQIMRLPETLYSISIAVAGIEIIVELKPLR